MFSSPPSAIATFLRMAAVNFTSDSSARCGWVGQRDQRGSIDIIWNCVSALLICPWVMLHLNVPAKGEEFWPVFVCKSRYLFLAVFIPELLTVIAFGQWATAKRSVAEMKQLGHEGWSMVHAFYAEMGRLSCKLETRPFSLLQRGRYNISCRKGIASYLVLPSRFPFGFRGRLMSATRLCRKPKEQIQRVFSTSLGF